MSSRGFLPADVEGRLRRVAELSDLTTCRRLEPKTDMSPEAISGRLRRVSSLRRLCLELARSTAGEEPGDGAGSRGPSNR